MSNFLLRKKCILIILKLTLIKTCSCDFDKTINEVLKSYNSCIDPNETEFWSCLESESISILRQVEERSQIIPLYGNRVELIRDKAYQEDTHDLSAFKPVFRNHSRKRSLGFGSLSLTKAFADFIKNRSLQVKIPVLWPLEMLWNTSLEGRGRKNRANSMLAGALLIGLMMTISSLALLSGKALMTSLIALTLAALSSRRHGSGALHGATTYEVINVPHHH